MSSIPESFKVLVKELNSLCLAVVPTGTIITAPEELVAIKPDIAAELSAETTSISDELKASTFDEDEEAAETEGDEEISKKPPKLAISVQIQLKKINN